MRANRNISCIKIIVLNSRMLVRNVCALTLKTRYGSPLKSRNWVRSQLSDDLDDYSIDLMRLEVPQVKDLTSSTPSHRGPKMPQIRDTGSLNHPWMSFAILLNIAQE
jgi:hypothetical protein